MIEAEEPESDPWHGEPLPEDESEQYIEITRRQIEFLKKECWLKSELEEMYYQTEDWFTLAEAYSNDDDRQVIQDGSVYLQLVISIKFLAIFAGLVYPTRYDCEWALVMIDNLSQEEIVERLIRPQYLNSAVTVHAHVLDKIKAARRKIASRYPYLFRQHLQE